MDGDSVETGAGHPEEALRLGDVGDDGRRRPGESPQTLSSRFT